MRRWSHAIFHYLGLVREFEQASEPDQRVLACAAGAALVELDADVFVFVGLEGAPDVGGERLAGVWPDRNRATGGRSESDAEVPSSGGRLPWATVADDGSADSALGGFHRRRDVDSGAGVELAEHVADVGLHGLLAEEQFAGDLGVGLAADDQLADLSFATGQGAHASA
jgi:hypothetical protein